MASKGVLTRIKNELYGVMKIHFTKQLGKYLGFKIYHGRVRHLNFKDLFDKVISKLSVWQNKLLNKPGRLMLANAVLSSLPAYGMHVQWFPQYACDAIDKKNKSFLWKGNKERGIHMVKWDTIMRSRGHGSLGVRITQNKNYFVGEIGVEAPTTHQSPLRIYVMGEIFS